MENLLPEDLEVVIAFEDGKNLDADDFNRLREKKYIVKGIIRSTYEDNGQFGWFLSEEIKHYLKKHRK